MENPCTIVMFGDSILKGCTNLFRQALVAAFPDRPITVVNAGVEGETSSDALNRLDNIASQRPDVLVIGFGMNDWRKGVDVHRFRENLHTMIDRFSEARVRVILVTMLPDYQGLGKGTSCEIPEFNSVIRQLAEEHRLRIADAYAFWKETMKPSWMGLSDPYHPNEKGRELLCRVLMMVVPRSKTTVLWAFDGAAVPCNYRCPYCYDQFLPSRAHRFRGSMCRWHDAFKKAFGNERLTFYISYGEAMLSKVFLDLMEMIASEPGWDMMMTSNISRPMGELVQTRLATEGRLNINASFHPTETSLDRFLEQLLLLRSHGIECPVIYVLYPPAMKPFEEYFRVFNAHGFLVHVRAYEGRWNGKTYPAGYTEEERRMVARYADDGTIRYMLNRPPFWEIGRRSYLGMFYIYVTSAGEVVTQFFGPDEFISSRYAYGRNLGNLLEGTMKLDPLPQPLEHTIERSVTDVACVLDVGYHELEGNFVSSFAHQGRVRRMDQGVVYPNLHLDFDDPKTRRVYGFHKTGPGPLAYLRSDTGILWTRLPHLKRHAFKKARSKLHRLLG